MPIYLKFQPTFRQHWTSAEFHLQKQKQGTMLVIGLFATAAALWALLIWLDPKSRYAWVMLGGFFIAGIVHLMRRVHYLNAWRTMPQLRAPREIIFHDDKIEFVVETLRSQVGWEYYKWYSENAAFYLFYTSKQNFSFIPKAPLSPELRTELKYLIDRKLPKK